MAYDVTGLSEYVHGKPENLMNDLFMEGKSFQILKKETGIKNSTKYYDTTNNEVVIQTGSPSGVDNYEGTDSYKDVIINVTECFIKKEYVKNDLEKTLLNLQMKAGNDQEDLPGIQTLQELNGKALNYENERLLWLGDVDLSGTTGQAGNIGKFDGFVKQLDAAGDYFKTGTAPVALDSNNALTIVNGMVDKMIEVSPELIGTTVDMYMSPRNFQVYVRTAYGMNGQINRDTIDFKPVTSILVPGTDVMVHAMPGLNGSNEIMLSRQDNFIIGCDLESEADEFRLDYLLNTLSHRLMAIYKLGAKVVRTHEVIMNRA